MSTPMNHRELREQAELLRMLAHPTRLAILRELAQGPRCVSDIQELVDVAQSNTSQHLTALRRHEIVDYHESGTMRCYYVARPKLVTQLVKLLDGDFPVVHPGAAQVKRAAANRGRGQASAT